LNGYYGTQALEDTLDFPIRMESCRSLKPFYAAPSVFGASIRDEFGVAWSTNEIDRGAPIGPCLPEPDLAKYVFPDPAAAYRYEGLAEWCRHNEAHYRILWVGDLWERATYMRGMEPLLLDLSLNPGFVEKLLRRLTDYVLRTTEIYLARSEFEGIALSDDYGTQRAMVLSPSHWRRFVKPRLAEIYDAAKRNGRTVFHHSCGNILPIIGDMIDIGLDVLHPIQPEAMDVLRLKKEFGRRLTFCGGVRTQDLLPHGTPEQIRAEVKELKEKMGRGGGYILEPGITLQADVPLENMVAMIEEARNS
jgi:uroporphyrinogen decarboxylase